MLRFTSLHSALLVVLLFQEAPPALAAEVETVQLRVTNAGNQTIEDLTVMFPLNKIYFGDVPAGATTEYLDVSGGVYRYAAYSFSVDGELQSRPVTDFFGEMPVEGTRFTYVLRFEDGFRTSLLLEEVIRDR